MWETYLFAVVEFLSTPSARRATQSGRPDRDRCVISIHALREEGDVVDGDRPRDVSISIHALREEGDYEPRVQLSDSDLFLSTPSARRATHGDAC